MFNSKIFSLDTDTLIVSVRVFETLFEKKFYDIDSLSYFCSKYGEHIHHITLVRGYDYVTSFDSFEELISYLRPNVEVK